MQRSGFKNINKSKLEIKFYFTTLTNPRSQSLDS